MDRDGKGGQPRRWGSWALFTLLLVMGLVVLGSRIAARPDVSFGEMALPLLGGLVMAVAIVVMVRLDRRHRRELPARERDRPDQGTPL